LTDLIGERGPDLERSTVNRISQRSEGFSASKRTAIRILATVIPHAAELAARSATDLR